MSGGVKTDVKTFKNYVNGQWVAAASGETFPVYDPSTEEVIAHVAAASAGDVDAAVKAAREAFDNGPWRQTTAQDRGRVLFKLAEKIRQNTAQLADIECRNTGKPIVEAEYDIADVATCFEYYGGLATKIMGHVNPVPANALSFTLREPVGVAAQIIPWNYPLLMAAWKLAPAIAAGCTCILKPAEQTPLTALEFANWFEEAGLPPGVVNIVNGPGETAGAALVAHPGVDKVAFTGSAAVGKIIVKSAADTLKRVTLELGGKSPNIFFAEADWEAAVDKRITLGPPLARETKMGPLVSKEQYDRVSSYLEIGKKEAKVAIGGGRPRQFGKGYYLEPTIFYDVENSARIAREEIFGPVASVIPFDGEADAIRIANDTPYGLAAAVWTRDIYKAFRVVKSLRAGIVWVNHMQPTYVEAPWGGYKQSGFGRELGPWGLEEYLETKQVFVNLDETPIGWY